MRIALRCCEAGSSVASAAMPSTLSTDSKPSRTTSAAITERPARSSCRDIEQLSYRAVRRFPHSGRPRQRRKADACDTGKSDLGFLTRGEDRPDELVGDGL